MAKINCNRETILDVLRGLTGKGHKYIYFTTRTTPKLIKSHRETSESLEVALGCVGIVKEKEAVFSVNLDYETKVNTNLDKAGFEKNFEAGNLKWGSFEGDSRIILEKGEGAEKVYYVRVYGTTGNKLCDDCKEVAYFGVKADGTEIELSPTQVETLKGFLPPEKDKGPLVEGGSFDAAKPLVNSYKLESITGMRYGGDEYRVK